MNIFSKEAIQAFVVDKLSKILGIHGSQLDTSGSLEQFELDSITSMEFVGMLEEHLQRPLSPTVLFDHPSIEGLAAHLASQA